MPKPLSFGSIAIGLTAGGPVGEPEPPSEQTPFRVLILGDFSGRANRGAVQPRLGAQRPILVDRDNLEQVMAKLGVALELSVAGNPNARVPLAFTEMDDFHPDRVYQKFEPFAVLRERRRRLSNPATFREEAVEVRAWLQPKQELEAEQPQAAPAQPQSLLEEILGGPITPEPAKEVLPGGIDWNAYLQKLVAPHVVPGVTPEQEGLVSLVDEATSAQMRAVLHHPDFQAMEAAWRALHFLVRRLETDGNLKLYLLDVSKAELAADLGAAENLAATGLYKLWVEETVGTPGGKPWALLAGLYPFGPSLDDVELLGRLAKLAGPAGAPFIAGASPRLLGCASLAATPDPDDWRTPLGTEEHAAWESLRQLPEAAYVGLVLPRCLLRLPYGKETNPIEEFAFEETPPGAGHESYLWGNSAFACVFALAEAFNRHGWDMRPGVVLDIEGLPLHVYEEDGERQVKPCAEVLLTMRAGREISSRGLMPVLSVQGRDAVHLPRFQSIASPTKPLAGRWRS